MVTISERIVARLQLQEDGSLSNPKVEQYVLLRAEEVIQKTPAWIITMSSAKGNAPSSSYQANVHKSPAFKARLETLMAEKAELQAQGVWGQLEWQAKQCYRKAAAMNDLRGMQAATDSLMKIALQQLPKPAKAEAPAEDPEAGANRGPGAPLAEAPLESARPDFLRERALRAIGGGAPEAVDEDDEDE